MALINIVVWYQLILFPDSKVHGANMGLTWVLSAPGGPRVGPIDLAIRVEIIESNFALTGTAIHCPA